jgi:inner membrane protein
MTNGGSGVAFFAPFHHQRYFLPWRPIHVSPITLSGFFSARGVRVLHSELRWIWMPAAGVAIFMTLLRRLA